MLSKTDLRKLKKDELIALWQLNEVMLDNHHYLATHPATEEKIRFDYILSLRGSRWRALRALCTHNRHILKAIFNF